jgi:hypothetical protein
MSCINGKKKSLYTLTSLCGGCKNPASSFKKIVRVKYKLFQKIKVLDKRGIHYLFLGLKYLFDFSLWSHCN